MSVPPSGVLCNVSESILSLRTPENDKKWNKIVKLLPDRWHRELEGYIVNDDETEQAITDIVAVEVQRKGGIDYLNGIEDQLYGSGIGLLLLLHNSNSTDDVAIKMLPALAAKFDQIRSALVSLEAHVARPPSNQRGKSSAKVASPVETLSSSSNCTPINAKSLGDSLACASDIFRNQRKDAPFKEEKENMRVASIPKHEATVIGPNEINPQFGSLRQQVTTIQKQMTAEQLAEVSENKVMAYYKERSFIQLNTQLQELLGNQSKVSNDLRDLELQIIDETDDRKKAVLEKHLLRMEKEYQRLDEQAELLKLNLFSCL